MYTLCVCIPASNSDKRDRVSPLPFPSPLYEPLPDTWGFPCDSADKRICQQCRRPGFNPWVGKTPGEGKGYPLSPWVHKELDMAE